MAASPSATGPAAGAHVRVRALAHRFAGRTGVLDALRGISFDARPGEFVALVGPSGCGKSTLLRLVGGLLAPQHGQILIDGMPPRVAQRAKRLSLVAQDPALFPWRTVHANVHLPLEVNRRAAAAYPRPDLNELLALVGLEGFARFYPHQLSGGMQQRVAIARALVTAPSLLLMDEPFGALDELTRAELRRELVRITTAARATVLFVTHSLAEAALLADRVIVLTPRPGRVHANITIALPSPRWELDETDPAFVIEVRRLRDLLASATTSTDSAGAPAPSAPARRA